MRQSSLVIYALLVGSLVVISPHSTRAADGFCDEIADYIRAGVGNVPIQGKRDTLIDVLAGRASGYIRLNDESAENAASALKNLHATPELMAAVKARFGDEFEDQFPDATIAWLQDDVGAVQGLFGHTGCTVMVFFDASDGHAREVPPPAGMSFGMTDLCGTPTRIGTIKSVPAVIEEEDSADLIEARITIVPWQHRQWGQICNISAAFSAALAKNFGKSRAFCRPEVDCPKLYRKMHDFAEDHLSQIHDEAGKMSESLRRMVAETPAIFEVPTFGKKKLAIRFEHKNLYELSLDGKRYVAIIGWDSSWSYAMMAALWQPSGNGLEPMAGFNFDWSRGKIQSVTVEVAE